MKNEKHISIQNHPPHLSYSSCCCCSQRMHWRLLSSLRWVRRSAAGCDCSAVVLLLLDCCCRHGANCGCVPNCCAMVVAAAAAAAVHCYCSCLLGLHHCSILRRRLASWRRMTRRSYRVPHPGVVLPTCFLETEFVCFAAAASPLSPPRGAQLSGGRAFLEEDAM